MAKQTVFALLDHMKKWLSKKYIFHHEMSRQRRSAERVSSNELRKDEESVAVENFVQEIKQHNLAIGKYRHKNLTFQLEKEKLFHF